jgi:hypothetical protein
VKNNEGVSDSISVQGDMSNEVLKGVGGGERVGGGGGGRGRERQGREGERGEGGRESFVYVCVYVCVCVRVFVCVCPGASHVTASEAPKKKQKVQELCIYKTK